MVNDEGQERTEVQEHDRALQTTFGTVQVTRTGYGTPGKPSLHPLERYHEYLAAGLPIVSTPVAGIPEAVVDGETGYLVEPGDRAALADRLARLAADPHLRARMGAAGRRRAELLFDAEGLVTQLRSLWQAVLVEHAERG